MAASKLRPVQTEFEFRPKLSKSRNGILQRTANIRHFKIASRPQKCVRTRYLLIFASSATLRELSPGFRVFVVQLLDSVES